MILFLFSLDFCLVFYHIYLKNIWNTFLYTHGIYVTYVFFLYRRYRRRWRSGKLRTVRLRLLRTRQACLNSWYDECCCMFAFQYSHGMFMNITLNVISHAHNRQVSFGKHYVVGYIFAWPCDGMRMGKMAVLWHASLMPDYLTSVSSWIKSHSHSFPSCTATCFPKGIWLRKLQIVFLVHTKQRGRDEGSMALD